MAARLPHGRSRHGRSKSARSSGSGFSAYPAQRAFRAGLRDLGYQEGRDVVIEYRWADGDYDRLPALLAELIASKVDIIVTHGSPGSLAASRATTTIPIVIAVVGDAIGVGLVSTLARPGGNLTGSTFFQPELSAKRLELIKEAMPNTTEIGTLLNLANPMNGPILPQMSDVAGSLGVRLHQFDARRPADFEAVVDAMAARSAPSCSTTMQCCRRSGDSQACIAAPPALNRVSRLCRRGRHVGLWRELSRSFPARGVFRRQS